MLQMKSFLPVEIMLKIANGRGDAIEDLANKSTPKFQIGKPTVAQALLRITHLGRLIRDGRIKETLDPQSSVAAIFKRFE